MWLNKKSGWSGRQQTKVADAARPVFLDTWTLYLILLTSKKEHSRKHSRRSAPYSIQKKTREISLCPALIEKGKGKSDPHFCFLLLPDVGAGKISGRDWAQTSGSFYCQRKDSQVSKRGECIYCTTKMYTWRVNVEGLGVSPLSLWIAHFRIQLKEVENYSWVKTRKKTWRFSWGVGFTCIFCS